MPRRSRIDAPEAVHHIIIRGIERGVIFRDDEDRDSFLDRLGVILLETATPCYSWSLLGNHGHFLLRTGEYPIAHVMRRLLTGYAVTFNRRHHRQGHLFQNRYKSILCEEDAYLKELVRYIHLNPLRAGLVKNLVDLESYPYSGHRVLMGKMEKDWQDRNYVLAYFGTSEKQAKHQYLSFVAQGEKKGRRPELVGGGLLRSVGGWKSVRELRGSGEKVRSDERILGGSEFVERTLKKVNENWTRKSRLRQSGIDLPQLVERISGYFGLEIEDLKSGSKVSRISQARAALCYVGVRKLGFSSVSISEELDVGPSAVSRAILRGQKLLEQNDIEAILSEKQ
jgi:putative transposase